MGEFRNILSFRMATELTGRCMVPAVNYISVNGEFSLEGVPPYRYPFLAEYTGLNNDQLKREMINGYERLSELSQIDFFKALATLIARQRSNIDSP